MHTPTAPGGVDAIHERVRDRICLRVYPPGTVLREVELAAEFAVSRTPVREALQRLALLGLVEVRNGVGTIVRRVQRDEVCDIYALRLHVAALIGELSPVPCRAEHLAAVARLRRESRDLGAGADMADYWRLNHGLHFVIAEMIGNSALRRVWDQLYFQVAPVWYGWAEAHFAEALGALRHELDEVLRALRDGDVAAVGLIQRNCIAAGFRRVMRELPPGD